MGKLWLQLLGPNKRCACFPREGPQAYMDEAMSVHILLYLLSFDSAVSMTPIRWQREVYSFFEDPLQWEPSCFPQRLMIRLTRRPGPQNQPVQSEKR